VRYLKHIVDKNHCQILADITTSLNTTLTNPVSHDTVRCVIQKEFSYFSQQARLKPYLKCMYIWKHLGLQE
jgi:hypothetical protein